MLIVANCVPGINLPRNFSTVLNAINQYLNGPVFPVHSGTRTSMLVKNKQNGSQVARSNKHSFQVHGVGNGAAGLFRYALS